MKLFNLSPTLLFLQLVGTGLSQVASITPSTNDVDAATSENAPITATPTAGRTAASTDEMPLITTAPLETNTYACNTCTVTIINAGAFTWDTVSTISAEGKDDFASSITSLYSEMEIPFVISYVTGGALPSRVHTLSDGSLTTATCCRPYLIEGVQFEYAYETVTTQSPPPSGTDEPTVDTVYANCKPTSTYAEGEFLVYNNEFGVPDESRYLPKNSCTTTFPALMVGPETKTIIAQIVVPKTETASATALPTPSLVLTHEEALMALERGTIPAAMATAGDAKSKPPTQTWQASGPSGAGATTLASEHQKNGGSGAQGGNNSPDSFKNKGLNNGGGGGGATGASDGENNDRLTGSDRPQEAGEPDTTNSFHENGDSPTDNSYSPSSTGTTPIKVNTNSDSGQQQASGRIQAVPTLMRLPSSGQTKNVEMVPVPTTTGSETSAKSELRATSFDPTTSPSLGGAQPSNRASSSPHENSAATQGRQIDLQFTLALSLSTVLVIVWMA